MTRSNRFERETLIRWDVTEEDAVLGTADPVTARRWSRKGYSLSISSRYPDGSPAWWTAHVPKKAISLRALVNGRIPTRKGGTPPRRNGIDAGGTHESSRLTASHPGAVGDQAIAGIDAKKKQNNRRETAA
jgi:hypothetical protein